MKKTIFCLFACAIFSATVGAESDLEKIDSVLLKMSERARAEIKISDKDAFLSDLNGVLSEDKSDSDLSLYHLVDKKHAVSATYAPKNQKILENNSLFSVNKPNMTLRTEAFSALEEMARGALSDGVKLLVSSAYRSYSYQERLFNNYVKADGLEAAERYSARPGTSQHQLGCAVDFGSITDDFAETKMGKWVYENAWKYGWTLSFPRGYEDVTGYMWECWHFRYVGKKAAQMQSRWFGGIQQYMLEFIALWREE